MAVRVQGTVNRLTPPHALAGQPTDGSDRLSCATLGSSMPEHAPLTTGLGCRLHSAPNLSDLHVVRPKLPKPPTDPLGAAFGHPQASPPQPSHGSHGLPSCRLLRGSPKLPDFLQRNPLPPILGSPTKVTGPQCSVRWVGVAHPGKVVGSLNIASPPLLGHLAVCCRVSAGHGALKSRGTAINAELFCAGWWLAP